MMCVVKLQSKIVNLQALPIDLELIDEQKWKVVNLPQFSTIKFTTNVVNLRDIFHSVIVPPLTYRSNARDYFTNNW